MLFEKFFRESPIHWHGVESRSSIDFGRVKLEASGQFWNIDRLDDFAEEWF